MDRQITRGDMYYADLTTGYGSEQSGYRPVLIISNALGNEHSATVITAAITSRTETKARLPTHCYLREKYGLGQDSLVLMEQIRTLDKARLREYIGSLDERAMKKVDRALAISVGLRKTPDGKFKV